MICKEYLGEGKNIEYKREIPSNHEKFLKDIIAFANTSGGKCIVGIDDKTLNVVGIGDVSPFKLSDAISAMISDACTPLIDNEIYAKTINGKTVLVIEVPPCKQRPYYLTKKGKEASTFIRVNGTSRVADNQTLKELEFQGANLSYDSQRVIGEKFDKKEAIALCDKLKNVALSNCKTRRERDALKDLTIGKLEDLGLLCKNGKNIAITNAFKLMTNHKENNVKIQCALFKGLERNIFIDKKEFDGPIYEQLEDAYKFVLNHINLGAKIEGLFRKDIYELPIEAIREVIANAVVHRSYLNRSKIQVSIFDDRIEVFSPGTIYGGLDIESIKEGRSSCRNEAIAQVFQYMKIIESWGTGIPKIINLCKEYQLIEPKFEEFGDGVRVTLYRFQANKRTSEQANKHAGSGTRVQARGFKYAGSSTRVQVNKVNRIVENSNKNKELIINYLQENQEATTSELTEVLKLSVARVRAILSSMDEIEPIGATNTRKYRLKH